MITVESKESAYKPLSAFPYAHGATFISNDRKVILFVLEDHRVMRIYIEANAHPRLSTVQSSTGLWKPVDLHIAIRG